MAVGLWVAVAALRMAGSVLMAASQGGIGWNFALQTLFAGIFAIQAVSLWRLSRWALISNSILSLAIHLQRYGANPNWADNNRIFGPYVDLVSWALTTALIVFHWRKMNWAPLGLPYRRTIDPVEAFT